MPVPAETELVVPSVDGLELMDFWCDSDPTARLRGAFPITGATGATGTTVVYLEVDPGNRIPPHTHNCEETVYVVEGSGEALSGDSAAQVSTGALIVIRPFTRHAFTNTGESTLRLVGFLPAGATVSWWEEPLQPVGESLLTTPIFG